jgi:hypothetical protein
VEHFLSLTFNSTKTIVGTVVSGFTASQYNFYDKNNFASPLQYTMGYMVEVPAGKLYTVFFSQINKIRRTAPPEF